MSSDQIWNFERKEKKKKKKLYISSASPKWLSIFFFLPFFLSFFIFREIHNTFIRLRSASQIRNMRYIFFLSLSSFIFPPFFFLFLSPLLLQGLRAHILSDSPGQRSCQVMQQLSLFSFLRRSQNTGHVFGLKKQKRSVFLIYTKKKKKKIE